MSDGTLRTIMGRIKDAPVGSPIAVFTTSAAGKLNAVFAATAVSKYLIHQNPPTLIGVYPRNMDMDIVLKELGRAI